MRRYASLKVPWKAQAERSINRQRIRLSPFSATSTLSFLSIARWTWVKIASFREPLTETIEKTYIAGESYAGTTIPYLAQAITAKKSFPTRLKGLLIGNGWFSPAQQYPAYVSYGKARGLIKGKDTNLEEIMTRCNTALAGPQGKGHVLVGVCESLIDAVMKAGRTT